ncbi:hypothetical protein DK254_27530 [Pseudomonas sp. RW407]|nr:hypothetical protein DK254_27530 [Pseudomonas sp. RW407]
MRVSIRGVLMLKAVIARFAGLREWALTLFAYMVLSVVSTVFIFRMVFGDLYVDLATAVIVVALIGVSLELRDSILGRSMREISSVEPSRVVQLYFFFVVVVTTYLGIPLYFFYWWSL